MAISDNFEKLKDLYTAIVDLDNILNSDTDEKFDFAVNVVKNLNKKEFSQELQNKIILDIREAIEQIYVRDMNSVNESISLGAVMIGSIVPTTKIEPETYFKDGHEYVKTVLLRNEENKNE